jgi:tetratricopeptide (TPR) repeat protein
MTVSRNSLWKTPYTLWSDTLKKSPLKPRVISAVGKCFADMGQTEVAIEYYKKALLMNPKLIRTRHHLFYAYIKLNQPEKALEVIKDPELGFVEHPPAYRIIANLFAKAGKYDESIKSYERLIQLEPENLDSYIEYGAFLIEINKPQKAVELFAKALLKWPDNPALLNNLGIAYEVSGRYSEAEEAYRLAIKIAPGAMEPKENLARLLNRTGK